MTRPHRLLSRRAAVGGAALAGAAALRATAGLAQSLAQSDKVEDVSMVMPGNITYRARLHVPRKTPAPAIIVVHDGWGATRDFDALGANLAFEGIIGLVLDLAGGKLAEDAAGAERLARQIDGERPAEVISSWYDWLRNRIDCDRRVGAFGFGPGGRWAVKGSGFNSAHGVAIWSARIEASSAELHSIYETFVGHFSDRDTVPGQVYVAEFTQRLRAAKREGHFYRYASRPNFYNPLSTEYDKADASLSWRRTMAVYKKLWALPGT